LSEICIGGIIERIEGAASAMNRFITVVAKDNALRCTGYIINFTQQLNS